MSKEEKHIFPASVGQRFCPEEVLQISTRGNNLVYAFTSRDRRFVYKKYFRDNRERGEREFDFLRLLWSAGIRNIPEPIFFDTEEYAGIYALIQGVAPSAAEGHATDVLEAITFIKRVNQLRDRASALRDAVESCFSYEQHLLIVERRVLQLQGLVAVTTVDREALDFVATRLVPAYQATAEQLRHWAQSQRFTELLSHEARILSPSDFGFHNSLKTSTGLHFVDFEYAGWDDPAKLICDFYNQPRIPAGLANLAHELPLWADACGWTATSLNERVRFLSPLYVIKWCCILMNEFLPDGAKRRIFSGEEDISERKIVQLQQAQKRLDSLHEFKWRACD